MAILAQALLQDAETLYTVPTGKTASFFVNINNSLTTPYIFSSASYDSVSFDVSSEDADPYSLAFNGDGTKFYVLGSANDTIFQYSLATAYDMSTASYDSVSFDVSSEDISPYSLAFNGDGTKFYVLGGANDTIFQYSLATAYDMSTVSYDSVSFDVSSEDAAPRSLAFNDDGTKFYVSGFTNDTIFQYSLATAYDMSTASYDSVSFDVSSEDTQPYSLAFNDDGTKFYVLGYTNDTIFQYSLATAYDMSTASYNSVSFDVSSEDTYPFSLAFNDDGTKFYVLGYTNKTIFQYSLATAYDMSTASYDSVSFDVSSEDTYPFSLAFNDDGTKFY